MISNITNALPMLLKRLKQRDDSIKLNFDLVETLNFYSSILPKDKSSGGLRHIYLDCVFKVKDEFKDSLKQLQLTLDTLPFLKEFDYIVDPDNGVLVVRSSMEELSIFSLIILGSIKTLPAEVKNQGVFISLVKHYMKFCLDAGYNVCKMEDIKALDEYNGTFDKDFIESIAIGPTSEKAVGTIHFVGIELNKDILKIFEKYKDVKFTYNEENASYIVTMRSEDWNDFWKDAPQYLKDEFSDEEHKQDIM